MEFIILLNVHQSLEEKCIRSHETKETLAHSSHLSNMCPLHSDVITFQSSNLTVIPNLFETYINLTTLELQNAGIVKMAQHTFVVAHQLLLLDLSHNNLKIIRNGMFSGANHLITLYLSSSNISSLEEYAFIGLNSLKTLELASNHLTSIPDGLFDPMFKLEKLRLTDNRLTVIGSRIFYRSRQMRSVELDFNKLDYLENAAFGNTILQWLDLSNNPSLRQFNLSDFSMRTLERLAITNTSLKSIIIPENVQDLNAEKNFITLIRFPTKANFTSKMIRLNLAENEISNLSPFQHFPNMQNLDLADNKITSLDYTYLSFMPKLVQLSLVRNPIIEPINVTALCAALPKLADFQLSQHQWTNSYINDLKKELDKCNVFLVVDNSFKPSTLPPHLTTINIEKEILPTKPTTASEQEKPNSSTTKWVTLPPATTPPFNEQPVIQYEEIERLLREMKRDYAQLESKLAIVMNNTSTTSDKIKRVTMRNETLNGTVENIKLFLWIAFASFSVCFVSILVSYFRIHRLIYDSILNCYMSSVLYARLRRQQDSQVGLLNLDDDVSAPASGLHTIAQSSVPRDTQRRPVTPNGDTDAEDN